jgi:hypothetical protein
MKKSAESLTLDDMGELLNICQDAYQGAPLDATKDILGNLPLIDEYLQSALGKLYMYRLISQQDLERIAMQAMAWCSEWACVSFGIGLEAGLGHIESTAMRPYLFAFNQVYARSLIEFLSPLLNHGKVDVSYAGQVGGELNHYINGTSLRLANSGQMSGESVEIQYEGTESPVAAFLQEIDVTTAHAGPGPATSS